MRNDKAHIHHTIDYIEFTVTDMAEAQNFYAHAFGWSFNDYGPAYAGIVGMDKEAGGLSVGTPSKTGGPVIVLFSENLEASMDNVVKSGGKIVKNTFSFPGGQRFHFTDPSGNELAVWALPES